MTRSVPLFLVLLVVVGTSCRSGLTSPASGPVVTEWRTVGDFDALEVSRAMEVIIREGASDSIRLDVSEGYLPYIRTTVANGTLSVYVDDDIELNNLDANDVTIWVPTLRGIAVSGASVVRGLDTLRTDDLLLLSSGASTVRLTAIARQIEILASGASVFDMAGSVDHVKADPISGASVLHTFDLVSRRTDVVLSGASIMETTTTDTLTVVASGASIVRYKGQPHITSALSGASQIQDLN